MKQQLFYMYNFYYNNVNHYPMPTFQCKMIFYNQLAMAEKIQNRSKITRVTVYQKGTVLIL